jgi:membrane protein implicated in regulation of membrane protease activity
MDDEALWKRRFLVFALIRLAGLATIFLGIAIAYSNLLREGGWPAVGLIVAIMGLIDAVFAPRLLRKQWEREDAQ